MQRDDTLRRLAYLVRHDHHTAGLVVGWLVQNASQEVLEGALELAEGAAPVIPLQDHLAIVRERYGPPLGGHRH